MYSLSGYLVLKSKKTLGKSNKRLWFAFNESNCMLEIYSSENEFITDKLLALDQVDISRSAIIPNFTSDEFHFNIL